MVRFLALLPLLAWMPLLAQPPPPAPWTPADSVSAALADAAKLPPDTRKFIRFLNLGNVPEADRPDLIHVLAGHVNALSREPDIAAPKIVPGTRGAVLRLDVRDYGWRLETWEKLFDPYSHAKVKVETITNWPGGTWTDGRYYGPNTFRTKKVKVITGVAPWLGKDAAKLAALTYSQAPIVSGQWFLWQTIAEDNRGDTGYYGFLGLKKQQDFEKLVRFDAKLAAQLEHRRVVIWSGVTQEPRRVERTATVLGGLWRTFDSAVATDKKNPVRILDDKDFQFDATEQIGVLPNGLPAFLLANGKGVLQSKAPDSVVSGERTSLKDARLHVGISCLRCHLAGKANMVLDIDAVPIKRLASVDYDKLRELRRQYQREISPLIERDRLGYAFAFKAASGLEAREYGVAVSKAYRDYDELRADLAVAARYFGATPQVMKMALAARGVDLDPVLSVIESGGAIPVRQFEEVQGFIWEALVAAGN